MSKLLGCIVLDCLKSPTPIWRAFSTHAQRREVDRRRLRSSTSFQYSKNDFKKTFIASTSNVLTFEQWSQLQTSQFSLQLLADPDRGTGTIVGSPRVQLLLWEAGILTDDMLAQEGPVPGWWYEGFLIVCNLHIIKSGRLSRVSWMAINRSLVAERRSSRDSCRWLRSLTIS